jgi:hypothetical protein
MSRSNDGQLGDGDGVTGHDVVISCGERTSPDIGTAQLASVAPAEARNET